MFQTVVPARVLSLETPDHLVRDQRLSVRDRERILNDLKAGIYEAGNRIFSFEIKKAPLSVKAVDQNVTVGDTIPEYTVLYEGFAGTDTADVLNGSLQFTCEYTPDSA